MAETDQEERTEEATEQRREDFRKRGQVAHTRELGSVFLLLGTALMMWALGRFFLMQLLQLLTHSVDDLLIKSARSGDYLAAIQFAGTKLFLVIAPLLALLGLAAFMASVVQVGILYNEDALSLDLNKINPLEGLKRMFSLHSFVEGIKACLKVALIFGVVSLIMRKEISTVPKLVYFSVPQLLSYVGQVSLKLTGGVGILMAVLAAADYFFQRWELEKQMRMTKEEVKAEHKAREGDPLIKARIRRVQKEMANKRMMEKVPTADVVITNPTHIAVVLKYDNSMVAPQLVAKGAGFVAEKIKALAREHNVPIVENKPLARTIYKTLKLGQTIPRELFTAVAQVLSYVYRLKRKVIR